MQSVVTKKASEQNSQIDKGTRNTDFMDKDHIQLADQSSMNMTTHELNTVTSQLKPKNMKIKNSFSPRNANE